MYSPSLHVQQITAHFVEGKTASHTLSDSSRQNRCYWLSSFNPIRSLEEHKYFRLHSRGSIKTTFSSDSMLISCLKFRLQSYSVKHYIIPHHPWIRCLLAVDIMPACGSFSPEQNLAIVSHNSLLLYLNEPLYPVRQQVIKGYFSRRCMSNSHPNLVSAARS